MSYISTTLNFLINAVKKAANPLTRDFNEIEQMQSAVKGLQGFSAAALDRVSKTLRAELQKGRPDFAVVLDGEKRPAASHFLVAPLDGFVNFIHGIPYFAVSVAMVENGSVTAAVIFNPATGELWFAEKGSGAFKEGFRNHERLRVSSRKELGEALVGANSSAFCLDGVAAVRLQGAVSLDLAAVAAGHLDAAVASSVSAGAMAAGLLLVKEAGGYAYELNQKDIRTDDLPLVIASGNLIAVNAELGKKLHQLLNK